MKIEYTPPPKKIKQSKPPVIFDAEYLLSEFTNILKNDPESGHRLLQNLMNVDYDFETKDGFYKILNEEQRAFLRKVYERRKVDTKFNQQVQYHLIMVAGGVALGVGVVKLIEYLADN